MNKLSKKAVWWSGVCYHKEQLDNMLSCTDIREYAWILHDKDKLENSEELKKPHWHFVIRLYAQQRSSWFKNFESDDTGLIFRQVVLAPQGAYDYLIHDTPKAKKDGKYLYDPSERISTIENFTDEEKGIDEHAALLDDIEKVVEKKSTWREFLRRSPKRIFSMGHIKMAHDLLKQEAYEKRIDIATGEIAPMQAEIPKIEKSPAGIKKPVEQLQVIEDDNGELPF